MRRRGPLYFVYFGLGAAVLAMLAFLFTCGGGGDGGTPSVTGAVVTTITDPAACQIPAGTFQNVWVTITRLRAHTSPTAGPNDSGWVDLVDLRAKPLQIDLLSLAQATCIVTQLGGAAGIPAGRYQQIRLHLLSNTPGFGEAVPTPNRCAGGGFNCVVTETGTSPLQLSSEAQSGIRIPSGQIARGGFTVLEARTTELNIDFNACSSIVQQGSSLFRLKPVLHAAEVSLADLAVTSIRGRVFDSLLRIPVGGAVVALEQADETNPGIRRIFAQTQTDAGGNFAFCQLPAGNFDLVATAGTVTATYHATVIFSVPVGTALGDLPLNPEIGFAPATISGQVSAQKPGGTPADVDVSLSAMQRVTSAPGSTLLITVPPLKESVANVATGTTGQGAFSLVVPAHNPQVGTFTGGTVIFTPPVSGTVLYWVNAQAFVPMQAGSNQGAPDCSPSSFPATFDSSSQIIVTPGANITGQNFRFANCQ